MNAPWSYIKLSQVMSSVKSDLNLYDDAGMIDNDRVIKIIAKCNEKLGQKIFKSRECKIIVSDYTAPLPSDFYKVENIFATQIINLANINPNFGVRQLEFSNTPPKDVNKMITYGKMGCIDSCNNCYFTYDRGTPITNEKLVYERIVPLKLSKNLLNICAEYSPCLNLTGEFEVNLIDNELKLSFETGEIYINYLGNLIAEDGEIEIPFHPKLNSYYEYAIKEKILEDIFLNSESDVINKLKYISDKKRESYAIAWDFVNSKEVNEWNKIQKNIKRDYYNKWIKILS